MDMQKLRSSKLKLNTEQNQRLATIETEIRRQQNFLKIALNCLRSEQAGFKEQESQNTKLFRPSVATTMEINDSLGKLKALATEHATLKSRAKYIGTQHDDEGGEIIELIHGYKAGRDQNRYLRKLNEIERSLFELSYGNETDPQNYNSDQTIAEIQEVRMKLLSEAGEMCDRIQDCNRLINEYTADLYALNLTPTQTPV
jgi:hypothetical protein